MKQAVKLMQLTRKLSNCGANWVNWRKPQQTQQFLSHPSLSSPSHT